MQTVPMVEALESHARLLSDGRVYAQTARTLRDHIDARYQELAAEDCCISRIVRVEDDLHGAREAGVKAGDWLIETLDGTMVEVVRIEDGDVRSLLRQTVPTRH